MKHALCLMILVLLLGCTGCVHLPGEEYAFAVVLAVDKRDEGGWTTCARIPDYQQEGSYVTLSADGGSYVEAMTHLNAAAPMSLHLGQLRMLIFGRGISTTEAQQILADSIVQYDVRSAAVPACTTAPVEELLDCMDAMTGVRLSKSLDILLETRQMQGVIPTITLGQAARYADRQSFLMPLIEAAGSSFQLKGAAAYAMTDGFPLLLAAEEMQMIALADGQMKKGTLSLPDLTLTVRHVRAAINLRGSTVRLTLRLETMPISEDTQDAEQTLKQQYLRLAERLAAANSDVFGLAGQAVRSYLTDADWRNSQWQERFSDLTWDADVQIIPAA